MPYGEGAAAPFAAGPHLFSHNGRIPGWPASAAGLALTLPPEELLAMEAATDSALLWALCRRQLTGGAPMATALRAVVASAAGLEARLNLLLTDGVSVAATAWGDTLWWRADARGVLVVSEPSDDEAGWHEVPDRSLLTATRDGVAVAPLTLSDGGTDR
jgi:glutamine amidotransferase